jgi:hypothetical protein
MTIPTAHRDEFEVTPKFRDLIPPATEEERAELAQQIEVDGIEVPLDVWELEDGRKLLIDGFTRLSVSSGMIDDLPYKAWEFDDEEEVIDFIIGRQLGRRNLSDQGRKYLRGLRLNRLKAQRGELIENAGENGDADLMENFSNKSKGRPSKGVVQASEQIAAEENVSSRTIRTDAKDAELIEKLHAKIKQDYLAGDVKLTRPVLKQLAELPKKQQAAAVKSWRDKEHKTIAAAVKHLTGDDGPPIAGGLGEELLKKIRVKLLGAMRNFDELHEYCPSPKRNKDADTRIRELLEIAAAWAKDMDKQ